ncbi:MAG: hypothetical protein QNJ63_29365 [Calothrix sp. MO_192.B10]|nr:hypothetical protein [Calothrix sp. MO_192.B10]
MALRNVPLEHQFSNREQSSIERDRGVWGDGECREMGSVGSVGSVGR